MTKFSCDLLCGKENNKWETVRCVLYSFHPILGGQTYLWFCAWVFHMVLGMMVFYPWYSIDPVKGNTVMF